jgi:hypothetical protein
MRRRDLRGMRFGKLTVIARAPNRGPKTAWYCECDCGRRHVAFTTHLTSGRTRSCGCYWYGLMIESRDAAGRLVSPWRDAV